MRTSLHQLVRTCALPIISQAAQSYVAGPELADALRVCRWVAQRGFSSTLCYWNRDTDEAEAVASTACEAMEAMDSKQVDSSQLSLKMLAMGFSDELLAGVLTRGRRTNQRVVFDSMGPETADRTLAMIQAVLPSYPNMGCTLPARWRRSLSDADFAVDRRLAIRIVKGQWEDPSHHDCDPRSGYLAVVDRLAGRASHVAIATHDAPLVGEALRRLRRSGTSCELELLYGMPLQTVLRIASEHNVPVRIYVPYGFSWMPYHLSLAHVETPKVYWWFARDLLFGRAAYRAKFLALAHRGLPELHHSIDRGSMT
jgi:proline dehydrogenase